ncbi:MAG: YjjG family noncanonical pyrimidine nucleotidase [Prevotella sp.]|jgi:putative hydrolase of the HAD superfamily|nr:YjjG family noncanonical pyrimidine nucleotidase [Prevotella sp.]
MKYTDILLDLDDTLIDTAQNTRETVKEIYEDYKLNDHFESFPAFFSFYHANVSKLWVAYNNGKLGKDDIQQKRFGVSLSHLPGMTGEHIATINADYIERIMQKEALVDGAMDLLEYLAPKYKLHILSNGFTEMQYIKMESARLPLSAFDNIILSDVVGVNKPHPGIFRYALDKARVKANETIMIGDNIDTDIRGAYDSGIDQIWFNPEGKSMTDFKPTYIVKRLSDIKAIL